MALTNADVVTPAPGALTEAGQFNPENRVPIRVPNTTREK